MPEPEVPQPLSPLIDFDLPCRECAYNLRGLTPDGFCPECATPVLSALKGNWLMHSEPDWLDGIRRSLSAMQLLLWIPLFLIQMLPFGPSFLFALVLVAFYIGEALRITHTEEGVANEAPAERCALRLTAALLALTPGLTLSAQPWVEWLRYGALVVELAFLWLYLSRVQRLAQRLPDYVMVNRVKLIKWVLPACWLLSSLASQTPRGTGRGLALLAFLITFGATLNTAITFWWLRTHLTTVIVGILAAREAESLPLTPPKD